MTYDNNKIKTEGKNMVPLPKNAYFKGAKGKALVFEVRSEGGMQVYCYLR